MTPNKRSIYNSMRMQGKIYLGLNTLLGPDLEPTNALEAYDKNFVKQTLLCLSTAVRYITEYMCFSESD